VEGERVTVIRTGESHVVVQGESVDSIAAACGHLPDTLWNAPENRALKQQRKDPHVLAPGDRLFVPPLEPKTVSVQSGALHRFTVQRPRSRLRVQLVEAGAPRANEPYVLVVDRTLELAGTTDGDGWVERPVPTLARAAQLTVGEGDRATTYLLALRALDPVTEASGVQARLRNLGYAEVPLDGEPGPATAAALCAFQEANGLSVSGSADAATRDKLVERHGS
jgi:putative peptidoglycan binding protein